MIHPRHILHPIRSAKSLYRKVSLSVYRRLAERQFRNIRRGQRDRCWCGGELLPLKWHPSYGVCAECGCYVNRRPPLFEELNGLYSLDRYWYTRQRLKGFPDIEHCAQLYRTDGRLDRWLELIEKFGPAGGRVIEVGCAPGALLCALQERGYECLGVEINPDVVEYLRRSMALDVHAGFFPGIELPQCDLFLAFDVLEHSPCPLDFMEEVARLIRPSGTAIIQTPIDRHEQNPPFKAIFDNLFDDLEHLYIFTDKSIHKLAETAGLEIISEERGVIEFDIIVLRRKDW